MFSRLSISEKREKLKGLVNSRKKKRKNREWYNVEKKESFGNENIKRKKLDARLYKRSFKIDREKVNLKQGIGVGNRESANEPSRISSKDDMAYKSPLQMGEPAEIDHGLGRLCAICMTGGELLLRSRRGWLCGSCTKNKIESCSYELSEFPFEVSSETRNHILPYVNKLRDYWHRGQNAVFYDCQDRLRKVVFFVLSLLNTVNKPILIIAARNVISSWEAEFLKWSKLTNFITYKGSKDARASIREKEFYSENGSVTFQVLLSSRDDIVEDLEMVNQIKWELIVIDRCQSPTISTHRKKIKMLMADMKLLTITSEILDYQNILSLLDPNYEEIHTDVNMETSDNTTLSLKEKLSPFIAFEYKYTHSNMEVLSSCLRDSSPLHDILTQTQKCCDHPYLVDPTLRNSSKKDVAVDTLGAEINVSGKLQLLDKFLLEIERRRLRVLILYQKLQNGRVSNLDNGSNWVVQSVASSEKVSIGDILDDLVDRRFGQDVYVRIPEKLLSKSIRRKKKQALKDFNNLQGTKFICLLDYRSCHSSICLSNVDVVILFNSDWNPLNNIRALQRITYECGPLRVFRLYSTFTLEEKALIFSKQGTILDVKNYNFDSTVFQQLLAWGACHLFRKLESSTDDCEASSLFIDHLVGELSALLQKKSDETGPTNCSIISNAKVNEGSYCRSISLLGEKEKESNLIEDDLMNKEPLTFWTNLLKENHQRQKNSSNRLSRRVQKSPQNAHFGFEDAEIWSIIIKRKPRSKRKAHCKEKQRDFSGLRARFGGHRSFERLPTASQNNQAPHISSFTPLGTELKRIRKEQDDVSKLQQEKKSSLLSECEKEILEVRKKYDAMIEESEMSSTNQMKIVEDYYKLVYANNLLAELLGRDCDKEPSTMKIPEISASALVRPVNPCSTSGPTIILSRPSPGGFQLRAPPPHLMSNPSLFASISSLQTTPKPSVLEPFNSSTLVPPANPFSTSGPTTNLNSNPSLFSSFHNLPTMPDPFFLDPLPNLSTSSKPPVKKEDLPKLPIQLDRCNDIVGPSLPFLG